jgi:hypothetical protein
MALTEFFFALRPRAHYRIRHHHPHSAINHPPANPPTPPPPTHQLSPHRTAILEHLRASTQQSLDTTHYFRPSHPLSRPIRLHYPPLDLHTNRLFPFVINLPPLCCRRTWWADGDCAGWVDNVGMFGPRWPTTRFHIADYLVIWGGGNSGCVSRRSVGVGSRWRCAVVGGWVGEEVCWWWCESWWVRALVGSEKGGSRWWK